MNKLVKMAAIFAVALTLFAGCSDDDGGDDKQPTAPVIAMDGADIDAVHEIEAGMKVKVNVTAPGKIAAFGIKIDSPFLTDEELQNVNLAKEMDLVTASGEMAEALKTFGFKVGNAVKDQTSLSFDISTLIPMIAGLYHETSDHNFTLTVTDAKGQKTTATLKFHLTGAPKISMEDADIDAVHEIEAGMKVKVNVTAPGKIAAFGIKIDSPALTDEVLAAVKLTKEMDLVTASGEMAEALKDFGFKVGDQVKDQTSLSFDISTLIPMITVICQETSGHNFILTVTDAKGQKTTATLKFHLTGKSAVTYNNDADVWLNTASLKVKLAEAATEVKVEYKRSTATAWQEATVTANADGTYKAAIAPKWVAAANHASGAAQVTLDNAAGVFAGAKYDYRVLVGGQAVEGLSGSFDAPAGQEIPGGNMNTWKKYEVKDFGGKTIEYYAPVAEDNTECWGSGNNFMTPKLCSSEELTATNKAANLQGTVAMGAVFAAGNLFTGVFDFVMSELNGYARFGLKYNFTARPSALKVRYKSKVSKYTHLGLKEDVQGGPTLEDTDRGRIFVCITDWTDRHSVMSGIGAMQDPTAINGFDPETDAKTDEGKILAYGSKWIEATVTDWTELVIPIIYKDADKNAKPTADNYSLVISTAASALGDYLCGSKDNELYLDDFEWVY